MKDFPAREKLDVAAMVSQYMVVAGALDKSSAPEEYDQANELSLELAMLLPAPIYRAMVDAAAHPDARINPAAVAVMMRGALGVATPADDLQPEQVAFHAPGAPAPGPKPGSRAH